MMYAAELTVPNANTGTETVQGAGWGWITRERKNGYGGEELRARAVFCAHFDELGPVLSRYMGGPGGDKPWKGLLEAPVYYGRTKVEHVTFPVGLRDVPDIQFPDPIVRLGLEGFACEELDRLVESYRPGEAAAS